jgi:thiol-disulfide isomerase/thioredoxin
MIRLMMGGKSFSGRERNCCFLNTGQTRFAGVSSVSGLDFADDGRACAVIDWDRDGRQDLWVTNRTSPRLRVMRNINQSDNHWLSLRLEGRTCNRDAIGARVEISFPTTESTITKTLRAGEGFLSQCSKWVHFGLGDQPQVKRVIVSWPDGTFDGFTDVGANRHYQVIQGDQELHPWPAPPERPQLATHQVESLPMTDQTRVVMALPISLEGLSVQDQDGLERSLSDLIGGPTLINFWQMTCVPCLAELTQWSQEADRFNDAGLSVLALHVDDPASADDTQRDQADAYLDRIQFPFNRAFLPATSLEKLDQSLKKYLQRHIQFVLPTSILLRVDGDAVVIYKGAVDIDQLLADAELVSLDFAELFERSLPFSGRWLRRPNWDEPGDFVTE